MRHAKIAGDAPVLYLSRFAVAADGTQTPLIGLTRAEKITRGIYEIEHGGSVPTGHVHIGWELIIGDGVVIEQPVVREMTNDEMHAALNAERLRRIEAGNSFPVAGIAEPIQLQGRPFDQTAYLALLTRASGYKAAGVTDPILTIRSADDVIYTLTPDQMVSLVAQAMTWFEQVMATSWAMKDGTGDFPAGIPANYTADEYWP